MDPLARLALAGYVLAIIDRENLKVNWAHMLSRLSLAGGRRHPTARLLDVLGYGEFPCQWWLIKMMRQWVLDIIIIHTDTGFRREVF